MDNNTKDINVGGETVDEKNQSAEKSAKTADNEKRGKDYLSAYDQDRYFGHRSVAPLSNNVILNENFGLKYARTCRYANFFSDVKLLLGKDNNKYVGIVPKVALSTVWRKAGYSAKGGQLEKLGVNESEWKDNLKALKAAGFDDARKVADLTMMDYCGLLLKKADATLSLLKHAILGDIKESVKQAAKWRRIWMYPYSVSLEKEKGGIFTVQEANVLRANKILRLNDIRKRDIYQLKAMLPEHDFSNFVKEINAAFKEDLARRRDTRYKIYPFIFGLLALFANCIIGYHHKYTLIKNMPMTVGVLLILFAWAIDVAVVIWAIIRVKKRRKIYPDYVYLTQRVKSVLSVFAAVSVFVLISLSVFYFRYDGYNSTVYYRNLGDNKITIAGLVDDNINENIEKVKSFTIYETIDGKEVVEIDEKSFDKESFETVTIPGTVTEIKESAFKDNLALKKVLVEGGEKSGVITVGENAFSGCFNLAEVGFSESVETISKKAFKDCQSLSSLSVFPNLESVGEYAFENCLSITELVLPGTMTEIGNYAFAGSGIRAITFGSNIETIGDGAFSRCENLNSVDFTGSNVTSLGTEVFSGCVRLSTVILPDTQVIPQKTFKGCTSLNAIDMPTEVITIEKEAFAGTSLQQITLHSGLKTIEEKAFYNCSIKEVIVPDTVDQIGEEAFAECYNLTVVKIPFLGESVGKTKDGFKYTFGTNSRVQTIDVSYLEKVDKSTFEAGKSSLLYVVLNNGVTALNESAFEGYKHLIEIQIPSTVSHVGDNVFKDCVMLNGADISMLSITEIGENVFKNSGVNTVMLPSTLGYISKGTFEDCKNLQSINIPSGVSRIEDNAFSGSGLSTVVLPDVLAIIGDSAFEGTSISSLVIPDSVQTVGSSAFSRCGMLTSVKTPFIGQDRENAKKGYSHMFGTLTNLTEIVITDMTMVSEKTFSGTKNSLQTVVLNEGVVEIGKNTFSSCRSLANFKVPTTVTTIGDGAFEGCYSLSVMDIALNDITELGKNVFKGAGLTVVFLPSKLESVSDGAFNNCYQLTAIDLPSSVKTVGKEAFAGSGLTNLSLNDVVEIGDAAYKNCNSLTSLYLSNSVESIGEDAFAQCGALNTAEVPFVGKTADDSKKGYYHIFGSNTYITSIKVNNMTEIKDSTFEGGRNSLEIVVLNEGVVKIGNSAFRDCRYLRDFIIPLSVTSIGDSAFEGCSNIYKIDVSGNDLSDLGSNIFNNSGIGELYLPQNLEEIPDGLVQNCRNLNYLELPAVVKVIGKNAFAYSNISNVNLKSVEKISDGAFKGTPLSSIEIPETVNKIGKGAFSNCVSLNHVKTPFVGRSRSNTKNGFDRLFNGSNYINSIEVTDLEKVTKNTFKGAEDVSSIRINEGVKEISKNAFRDFTNLTEIYLPSTTETVGNKAFQGCIMLKNVDLSGTSISTLGASVFEDCYSLENIILPITLKAIPEDFVKSCGMLMSIDIPSSVTEIGDEAFSECYSLQSIRIPDSVKTIDSYAFNRSALTHVEFGSGLKTIGRNAFSNCMSLTSVILNEGLENVGTKAFSACSQLNSAYLPESVVKMGRAIFKDCDNLEELIVPFIGKTQDSIKRITYLTDNHNLKRIYVTNAKAIKSNAFIALNNLRVLVIADTVEEVEEGALNGCYMVSLVYLPKAFESEMELVGIINNASLNECLSEFNLLNPYAGDFN